MRPYLDAVKQLVIKHVDILEVARLSSGIGIQINILDRLNLLDIAMDIIGFPQDNTLEFDTDIIDNGSSTQPNKRKDFDNMFSRDQWKAKEYELEKSTIDYFVNTLYIDYEHLVRTKPHLFVKA